MIDRKSDRHSEMQIERQNDRVRDRKSDSHKSLLEFNFLILPQCHLVAFRHALCVDSWIKTQTITFIYWFIGYTLHDIIVIFYWWLIFLYTIIRLHFYTEIQIFEVEPQGLVTFKIKLCISHIWYMFLYLYIYI